MMISKTIYRGSRVPAASRLVTNSFTVSRSIHNTNIDSKGIKETLEEVNKRVGKAAAEGIEKTEDATHHLGENIHQAEAKVKEVFSMGSKKASNAAEKAGEVAEQGKEHAQAKGREAAARGKEKLDDAAEKLKE